MEEYIVQLGIEIYLIVKNPDSDPILVDNGNLYYCQQTLKRLKKANPGTKYSIKRLPSPLGLKPQQNGTVPLNYKPLYEEGPLMQKNGKYPKDLKTKSNEEKARKAAKVKAFQAELREKGVPVPTTKRESPLKGSKRKPQKYYEDHRKEPALVKTRAGHHWLVKLSLFGRSVQCAKFEISKHDEAQKMLAHKLTLRSKLYNTFKIPKTTGGIDLANQYIKTECPKLWAELLKTYPKR